MKIGKRKFNIGNQCYVMGILNVTPDSFFDGGRHMDKDTYLKRVETMITEGCDILDIGGQSTRPGHKCISEAEEIDRVAPVIENILRHFELPISLDTYKAAVAEAGISAGADMINDVWGLRHDERMAALIAREQVACCLMHNRRPVGERENNRRHLENVEQGGSDKAVRGAVKDDLIDEICASLTGSVDIARSAGIADEQIILDPGIGFGKNYEENLHILAHLAELKIPDFPWLLGASRKSVIGLALDVPVEERLEGSIVTTVMAVMAGFSFVRVHDIAAHKRAVRMCEAVLAGKAVEYIQRPIACAMGETQRY